ncbi:unnamed protein product [Dovyalis caffra]|uniref:Uncharacterized protein n=1 Tax=Dovyalis caffra TaxID=77055 RepID=A0AAV1S621_9ROSI|nr:unnamed protein product [Dovyalis caffra]
MRNDGKNISKCNARGERGKFGPKWQRKESGCGTKQGRAGQGGKKRRKAKQQALDIGPSSLKKKKKKKKEWVYRTV